MFNCFFDAKVGKKTNKIRENWSKFIYIYRICKTSLQSIKIGHILLSLYNVILTIIISFLYKFTIQAFQLNLTRHKTIPFQSEITEKGTFITVMLLIICYLIICSYPNSGNPQPIPSAIQVFRIPFMYTQPPPFYSKEVATALWNCTASNNYKYWASGLCTLTIQMDTKGSYVGLVYFFIKNIYDCEK